MTTKRNIRLLPQVESTVHIAGITAPIIKCKAHKSFIIGNASVKVGEVFFFVRSVRRKKRYHIVKFNAARHNLQCSCGQHCRNHDHTMAVQQYVNEHNISIESLKPIVVDTVLKDAYPVETVKKIKSDESIVPTKQSDIDWKAVAKRDKARQRALRQEYIEQAKALREASSIA